MTQAVENPKQEQTLNQGEIWLVPSQQIELRRRGEPDLREEEEVRKQELVQMLTQQVLESPRNPNFWKNCSRCTSATTR